MNGETWAAVMALKGRDNRHQGVANTLTYADIETIVATAEFFGADDYDIEQIIFDLRYPRYRVFDWLAMCVMGRIECRTAVQVFVYSFLKVDGDVTAFIKDLRTSDYQVYRRWEDVLV